MAFLFFVFVFNVQPCRSYQGKCAEICGGVHCVKMIPFCRCACATVQRTIILDPTFCCSVPYHFAVKQIAIVSYQGREDETDK